MFSKTGSWRGNELNVSADRDNQVGAPNCHSSQRESSDRTSGALTVSTDVSIEIVYPEISSVAILAETDAYDQSYVDPSYAVSGGIEGKIQQWRVEDGRGVGKPIDAGSAVCNLAVTRDGRLVVCGTQSGQVIVWNARSHAKVNEFKAHDKRIGAVDVLADGTKIATGADDNTLRIWSFPAGQLLLSPLEHNNPVVAVKFSPDGKFIATASGYKESIRIYDSSYGRVLVKFEIRVNSLQNESLAWASDAKRLFALSKDGNIYCIDASAMTSIAKWHIHSDDRPICIALACNDTVIAASANSSVSFWDTTTHQRIGAVVHYSHDIWSMAISQNHDIATAGDSMITFLNLCDILPARYCDNLQKVLLKREIRHLRAEKDGLEDTVRSLRVQDAHQNRKITHLNNSGRELRCALAVSQRAVNQLVESTRSLSTDLHPHQGGPPVPQIVVLEKTTQELHRQLAVSHYALSVHDKMYECENMYARGHIYDAVRSLLEILNTVTEELRKKKFIVDWLQEFAGRCVSELRTIGDEASRVEEYDTALSAYSVLLSFVSSPCIDKLETRSEAEMEPRGGGRATRRFSHAPSLYSMNSSSIIVKCCKIRACLLEEELLDITKITERDPSNYKAFKRKHAILHSLGRYKEAFEAYNTMLSKLENSVDPQIQDMQNRYIDATPLIRKVIEQTIRDIPHVLIDITTGLLCDKSKQVKAFEESSIFNELRSSMIICDRLDRARIQWEVEKFYEYVMLSHKWQPPEPSFQMVENTLIYALPPSITNNKLIKFCKLVQSRRFRWAWSDTCCVNQSDKGVHQESIVAMFQWYCRAALTIVHLLGVHSKSQKRGSLWKSIWNTRGWTYQEYVASKVIQFYTEDWKPYLDLNMFNHKESPLILSEMEQATKFSTEALATLRPGLTRTREKLYLASKRETTRVEDIAYSLFGIFDVTLPVVYGEGKRAVGRLLEHVLTRSDNVTILAWTGVSGGTHSYLPSDLSVYDQVIPPHVPQAVESAEMQSAMKSVQSSLPDPSLAALLYEQLYRLPPLSLLAGRLRLAGLVFPLDDLKHLSELDCDSVRSVYRATSPILGNIWIETKDNLLGMQGLVLVHPWISLLIDEDFWRSSPRFDLATRALRLVVRLRQPFGGLLLAPQSRLQYERVATDSFIKVQIRAETSLDKLMESIRTVDIQ